MGRTWVRLVLPRTTDKGPEMRGGGLQIRAVPPHGAAKVGKMVVVLLSF